jgi:chromosome segregation ATPase
MKENSVADVGSELRTAQQELVATETQESELRAELRPLVEEKVEAEMNGKKLGPQKERRLSLLRAKLDEVTETAEAQRGRVRQLHLLNCGKDMQAARERQHKFVAEATAESAKITALLLQLSAIRRRIAEVEDAEFSFISGVNARLGLIGLDRIQARLKHNTGCIVPPQMPRLDEWDARRQQFCEDLADF